VRRGAFDWAIDRWNRLGYTGREGRAFFVSGFQGRLHEVGIRCRNSHETGDAAFVENREPGDHRVCRKDLLWKSREKFLVKLFWEKFGEVDHCWS